MTQSLSVQQLDRLHADLHPSRVATRDQSGRQLSYLEAYDVRATLVRIFGYGGFSAETTNTEIVHQSQYKAPNSDRELWRIAVVCTFRLTIHQTGAVYTESAAASQSGPDFGEVLDFAIKTAESDALKRAATNLGTQFGLSLYRNGATQDVVRAVFAPEQWEIIEDLKVARGTGPEAAAAKERMQARLKTQPAVSPANETGPVDEIPPPTEPATAGPVEETVPPDPGELVPPVDPVKLAAKDLAKVVAGKKTRQSLTAVS
jgi:recombination DNA repair RAD52 pathway protein